MDESIKEIEVKEPIVLTKTGEQMEKQAVQEVMDINKMKPHEIKAYLETQEREKAANAEKEKKKYTQDRDDFLETATTTFKALHNELTELKAFATEKATELYQRMWQIKGKIPKEVKSFQLVDKSNKFKITIERAERFKFTEEATIHIHSIKDIFKRKFEARNKGFYDVLDGILMRNSKGEYDAKLLAKARQQIKKLGDSELIKEFEALEQCQTVESTATYVRAYIKNENHKWEDINVQFSSL